MSYLYEGDDYGLPWLPYRLRNYGTLSLSVTSPVQTFAEPLSVAEVKEFLNLPQRSPADAAEDVLLEGFISGAREEAEILQSRDLVVKSYDLALDYFPGQITMREPLIGVDLFQYRDSTGATFSLTQDADFIVDLARALAMPVYSGSWPTATLYPSSAVLLRFRSGMTNANVFWADAGTRVKIGMKLLISHWFNGRLPFEATRGIMEFPFGVTQLLSTGQLPRIR